MSASGSKLSARKIPTWPNDLLYAKVFPPLPSYAMLVRESDIYFLMGYAVQIPDISIIILFRSLIKISIA